MKKEFFIALFLVLSLCFSASVAVAKDGQESQSENEGETMSENSQQIVPRPPNKKVREIELKKREQRVNSATENISEASKNFEQTMKQTREEFKKKMLDAKKERTACLQARAQDIRTLERDRTSSVSALLASCSPKVIQSSLEKPEKPSLEGLSTEEKKSAIQTYKQAMKEFNSELKKAIVACKAKVAEARQDFREKLVGIKEQCSNTERTVLGLSTEVPYNQ